MVVHWSVRKNLLRQLEQNLNHRSWKSVVLVWIFLPLMVYSIKQSLEEAVREIKKLNNI